MSEAIRYLCFTLGTDEFALPLLAVREVLAQPEITPVPHTPAYFLGIMNLRGRVVSVMDLRAKLGIPGTGPAQESAVIICQLGDFTIGITVDGVSSVIEATREEVSDASGIAGAGDRAYIAGVYRKKDDLVLLLNVAKALGLQGTRSAGLTAA